MPKSASVGGGFDPKVFDPESLKADVAALAKRWSRKPEAKKSAPGLTRGFPRMVTYDRPDADAQIARIREEFEPNVSDEIEYILDINEASAMKTNLACATIGQLQNALVFNREKLDRLKQTSFVLGGIQRRARRRLCPESITVDDALFTERVVLVGESAISFIADDFGELFNTAGAFGWEPGTVTVLRRPSASGGVLIPLK
jgi:hypothetical protein